jgi:hypothetical protein
MGDEIDDLKRSLWPERDPEPEELYQALAKALIEWNGKLALRHRLIVDNAYDPAKNAEYNREAARLEVLADQLRTKKQWWEYVSTHHHKDFWPVVLEEIKDVVPPKKWWKCVRDAWYLSDELWLNRDVWMRVFADRARVAGITAAEEAKHLARQKDPLTVYRGCRPEHVDGMSWALSFDAAVPFKRTAGPRGVIYCGVLKKEHVIVYLSPNNEEFEVIVSPGHVTDKEIVG